MPIVPIQFDITTDASGDYSASVDITEETTEVAGVIYAVEWRDGDLADGVDAVLKMTNGGVDYTLLTLTDANNDAWYFPVETEDDNTGAAGTSYRASFVTGRMTLTVSSGGNAASGVCVIHVLV